MNSLRTHSSLVIRKPGKVASIVVVFTLVLAGCDSAGSSYDGATQTVNLGFSTISAGNSPVLAHKGAGQSQLTITGSNGTLALDAIGLVVDEFELEGDLEISEFEAGPSWIDLPLDETLVEPVASADIPEGIYTELEFEVEDFDFEDVEDEREDEARQQQLLDLLAQIRGTYSNWPEGASMVVVGTFTPGSGGAPVPFLTYLEAEIEIEMDLVPPIEVTSDGPSRSIVVRLDPAMWFSRPDGTIWNLSAENFADTQSVVEFEAEFENGVVEIEIDDD